MMTFELIFNLYLWMIKSELLNEAFTEKRQHILRWLSFWGLVFEASLHIRL